MRLATKFTLALMTLVVAAFALQAASSMRQLAQMHEADLREDVLIVGSALGHSVSRLWELEGQRAAQAFVLEANERRARTSIGLLAPSNDRTAAPRLADVVQRGDAIALEVPVVVGDAVVAQLEIRRSVGLERDALASMLWTHASIGAGLLLVCGLLTLWLGLSWIGRPIEQLVLHARRVAGGDYDATIALERRDELGRLAEELDGMTRRVAEARNTVRAARKHSAAAQQRLRHADRLSTLGKLSSVIAHELGTPLNVVAGRATMIADDDGASALVRKHARVVVEQASAMTRIIQQILDFARRRSLQREQTVVGEVVEQAIKLIEPLADDADVALARAGQLDLTTSLDVQKSLQVLTNLMINAIAALPAGGTVTVHVSTEAVAKPADPCCEPGEYMRIDVIDDGIGMTQPRLDRIFEPFYTSKANEGTGLGLSVCQGIAQEHGGFIEVESEMGEGSRFSVFFPLEAAA